MERMIEKLLAIKGEVLKNTGGESHVRFIDRIIGMITSQIGENPFSIRLEKMKNVSSFVYEDERKALSIEIDSIIDYIESISTKKTQFVIQEKTIKNTIDVATRRNILDAFLVTKISWYGKLDQINFLSRLFDLTKLPSSDSRFRTADEDIHKHTVLNYDWPDEWIFTDKRFNLLQIQDSLFLDFLCLTVHPTVRDNNGQVVTLIEIYNNNLLKNGYEIASVGNIAGRPIFEPKEKKPVPEKTEKAKDQNKIALVIGCSDYLNAGYLVNPLNDANSIESKLKSLGFYVMKILNPSQKDLKKAIDDFGNELKGNNIGLFYFAGHGVYVFRPIFTI